MKVWTKSVWQMTDDGLVFLPCESECFEYEGSVAEAKSIVKGLFGGKSSSEKILNKFTPASFTAPGLTGQFNRGTNTFNVQRTAEGQRTLDALRGGFEGFASTIRGLRPDVAPGFGRLTKSRVDAIRGAGRRAVGNLREELSRRRVLGSSFAQREVAATEAEFGRQEEAARAESFLQELELTRDLIGQEFQASIAGSAAVLDQLNFETTVSTNLSNSASQQMQANITAQAQARSSQEAGTAEFLGTVIGAFLG
jgi:hypothetical protein